MDDFDLQLLADNPPWQRVLSTYLDLLEDVIDRPEDETGARWVDRIHWLDGIDSDELAAIHGHLIALDWLKFQLEDGKTGLSYRVSSAGRMVLERLTALSAGPDLVGSGNA